MSEISLTGLMSHCLAELVPSGESRGEPIFLAFCNSWRPHAFHVTCDPFLLVVNLLVPSSNLFLCPDLPLIRMLVNAWARLHDPG